jgi:hypothetical protein
MGTFILSAIEFIGLVILGVLILSVLVLLLVELGIFILRWL